MAKQYGITARLTIGGDPFDLSAFSFVAGSGQLGAGLNFTFADFAPVYDSSQPVTFEIGVTKNGVTDFAVMLEGGRFLEESATIQFAGDEVQVRVVNKLAQRWRLTPRQPVTLYDPDQIDVITTTARSREEVVDSDGNVIETLFTPVADFDLGQLLQFVYVNKLGFSEVITNIDSFPLPRADFGLRAPWHNAAAGQVALFEPQFVNDDADRLFIVDAQGTLPEGFPDVVRNMGPNAYAQLTRQSALAAQINAVLLTYRDNFNAAGTVTERVLPTVYTEVGSYGEEGYQRIGVTKSIYELHTDAANPDRVTREIAWREQTDTWARADGLLRLVSREVQTDQYAYDYQLKVGYVKTVEVYTALPGLSATLRLIQTVTNQIAWETEAGRPSNMLKVGEVRETTGSILVEGEEGDEDNPLVRTAVYDANREGNIPDDAEVQTNRPIKTLIEVWEQKGPDQIEVRYQEVDHLKNRTVKNETVPHTGTLVARLGLAQQVSRTMLFRDEDSEEVDGALPPAELNAGDVPFEQARTLAERVLARHGNGPQRVTIALAGIDVGMRRGSLRRVADRAGQEYLVFITGYQINGQNLGSFNGASVSQTAEGIVLQVL